MSSSEPPHDKPQPAITSTGKRRLTADWVSAWSSVSATVCTVFLLLVALWQLDEQAKASRDQIADQDRATQEQSRTSIRPYVGFFTRVVDGKGNFLFIGNIGVGSALSVVTITVAKTSEAPLTVRHREFLGPHESENVNIQELSSGHVTQETMQTFLNASGPVTTCIRYQDLAGYPYQTWQRFYPVSKTDFNIEVAIDKKDTACPSR